MTDNVVIDGLKALRRIDRDEVSLSSALSTIFRDAGCEVSIVRSPRDTSSRDISPWFVASEAVLFYVDTVDDHAVILSTDRVSDAIAILDAIDPLLARIERALGISMDATAMAEVVPDEALQLSLSSDTSALRIAVPWMHPRRDAWIERAATIVPNAANMPCIVAIEAAGPRLTIAQAGDLGDGDLLLVRNHAPAVMTYARDRTVAGMIDLTTGRFNAGQNGASMADDTSDFLVPLTIRLPDRMTSAASLAAMMPGTTLALGPLTDGMPVELRVADRLLARGELVQLGDRFAVLIESRADIADPVVMESGQ